jgi:Ulp1 family protease
MTTRANLRQWTDLLSLTDKIWLPTQIIEAYMKLLETEFVTVTYVNWNDLPDPKEAKFLRDSRVKKLVKTKISIYFMNLSNSHWIAVKMDLIENYVAIADSLFNTFQHLHNDIFSNMAAIAKAIGCDQALNCYSIRVPDQSNSVDCGVHTCLYMLYMSQNVSVHTREFLLSDII